MQFRTMQSRQALVILRALASLLAAVAILGSGPVRAADQFWVSLGSFSDLRGAEEIRDRAASNFFQLSIIPSESPIGFVYRVVEGPMADRPSAEVLLRQARNTGFIDAWLVIHDGDLPFGEIANSTSTSSTPSGDTFSETTGYESSGISDSYTLPPIEDNYTNAYSSGADFSEAPSSEDYNQVKIGNEKLVETAPPGYGLHRLERSVNTMPPGATPDSMLRELRTDPEVGREVDAQIDAEVDDLVTSEPNQ